MKRRVHMTRRLRALSVLCGMTGIVTSCSGGGSAGGLDGDCQASCSKIAAACAVSAADCVGSCENTSTIPGNCVVYADDLASCAATSGTVTCKTNGQYEIDGCTSQAEALSNCISAGSNSGNGSSNMSNAGNAGRGSIVDCNADGTWNLSFQWSGRNPGALVLDISGTSVDQLAGPGVSSATGTISVNGSQLTWVLSDGSTWTGNAGTSCNDITEGTMTSSTGNPGRFTGTKASGSGSSGGSSPSSCSTSSSAATCGAGSGACDSSHCCPSNTPYGCVSLLECFATADDAIAACGSACLLCGR